ncbi:MAG: isoprenylcysteine carboxylmethyltransferase family protein [Chloroflexi bacterium]|nr:isoprenylcysteine carboxylmethyltransferase family protein [Chloroflexota bacterium]
MTESIFHTIFIASFLAFVVIRGAYRRMAEKTQGKIEYREGKLHMAVRLFIGLPYILSLFVYIFRPDWFAWAGFSLPLWARWLGAAAALVSVPLIWWVQWALGSNFSTTLHVRQEHTLVTHGPYHWVRHPMYTVLFIQIAGYLLLTANWLLGGIPLVALTLIVVTRVRNEEAVMTEKFGAAYRAYILRTGRFLPRIFSAHG